MHYTMYYYIFLFILISQTCFVGTQALFMFCGIATVPIVYQQVNNLSLHMSSMLLKTFFFKLSFITNCKSNLPKPNQFDIFFKTPCGFGEKLW